MRKILAGLFLTAACGAFDRMELRAGEFCAATQSATTVVTPSVVVAPAAVLPAVPLAVAAPSVVVPYAATTVQAQAVPSAFVAPAATREVVRRRSSTFVPRARGLLRLFR